MSINMLPKKLTMSHIRYVVKRFFVKKKYRDELFRYIFSNKKVLLELYNAINNSDYHDESQLTFYTIENIIYMGYKNDLSFIVCGMLNLYEHQSSINPNMPLRGVFYFARQYEAYIKQKKLNIYGKKLVKIPVPQYIVFYNGNTEWMKDLDKWELSLSEAFEMPEKEDVKPCLECKATVYNINYGHNEALMKQCRTLEEYSILNYKIADNLAMGETLPVAVDMAVRECIEQNILREFLIKHQAEVIGMILEEFNMKEFLEMDRRDEFAAGREEGLRQGIEKGIEQGIKHEHGRMVVEVVDSAMTNFHVDLETACEGLGITVEEYNKAKQR